MTELEARDDVDEDDVAGVYYALKAISDPSHAPYAASRAMDAAIARVPYPDGASAFRPLAEDAGSLGFSGSWLGSKGPWCSSRCLRLLRTWLGG